MNLLDAYGDHTGVEGTIVDHVNHKAFWWGY